MPTAPFTKSGLTIVQDFAASAQSSSKKALDFSIGSVFRALAEGTAAVSDWLQKLYLFALLVSRLQTSAGIWVDTFCADFMPAATGSPITADLPDGSPRLPASNATGTVTFSRSSPQSQVVIPIGSEVVSYDNTQVFTVVVDATNSAYSATIIPGGGYIVAANVSTIDLPVQALTPGVAGNVASGAVTLIRSSLVGVDSVTNASAFSSGLDQESDDALKARFKLFILSLRAGTVDAIAYAIVSLRQGLQYAIHENVDPNGLTDNGSVVVYVDDGSGAVSSTLVSQAAIAVNAIRAGGTRPQVLAATKLAATANMTISVAAGYSAPSVVAAVQNAIGAYMANLQLEQTLPFTMLEHVAYNASAGVTNVTGVTLNGVAADLVPAMGQTIKATTNGITVSAP